jgi:hypothetical protein
MRLFYFSTQEADPKRVIIRTPPRRRQFDKLQEPFTFNRFQRRWRAAWGANFQIIAWKKTEGQKSVSDRPSMLDRLASTIPQNGQIILGHPEMMSDFVQHRCPHLPNQFLLRSANFFD